MHTIAVEELEVLDLTSSVCLERVGLDHATIDADNWHPCQQVGEAAAALGYQAILAPSATVIGHVLAAYEQRIRPGQLVLLDSSPYDYPDD